MKAENVLQLNQIKFNSIPFHSLNSQWNAWLAGNSYEPRITFDEQGNYDTTGKYLPCSSAYGKIMNRLEEISNNE